MGTGRSRSRGRIKDLPGYSYDDVDHDTMLDMARGRGYRDVSVGLVSALGEMGVQGFCKVAGPQDIRWQAVFMVGPAGAGKTWYRDRRYLKHVRFKLIDPDEVKKTHPEYDPEQPYKVHDWSKEVSDAQYKGIVESGRGDPVVVDGTGRDASGIARKMQLARRNGYRIFLIYIWVPLEVSIWRNRNRARFVPEAKVVSAYGDIEKSFMKLKGMTDKFRVVPNFSSSDLRQAQDDAKVYPYPQVSRPPRPGDGNYGLDMADRAASEGVVMTKHVARELELAFEDIKVAQHLQNVKTLELLTERELTRALRDAMIAEQEAVKQYETIVDSTDNERVKAVLQDIADEERVHVGELQALLNDLLDDEEELVEEGMDEVEEIMES